MNLCYRNRRFIDIAINLTDCVFFGIDRKGNKIHESDIDLVIKRAIDNGVEKLIITGTDLEVSSKAITMCRQYPGICYCTVGVHPAHSDVFLNPETKKNILASIPKNKSKKDKKSQQAPAGTATANATTIPNNNNEQQQQNLLHVDPQISQDIINQLRDMVTKNRDVVVAIGECGLDYAELSPIVTPSLQSQGFQLQANLAKELQIPLLLHSRDCGLDFLKEMKIAFPQEEQKEKSSSTYQMRGVTHSFNGPQEELSGLLQMTSIKNYFGVNASAFRDATVAQSVAKMIPEDRLMIETDAPWCDPRPTDWGYVAADRLVLRESKEKQENENDEKKFITEEDNSTPSYSIPPVVDKTKFEMGMRVNRRNEPCTLPAVFAELCYAKGIIDSSSTEQGEDEKEKLLKKGDELADRIYKNVKEVFFSNNNKSEVVTKSQSNDDE